MESHTSVTPEITTTLQVKHVKTDKYKYTTRESEILSETPEAKIAAVEFQDENSQSWAFEMAESTNIKIEPPSPEREQNKTLVEVVNGRVTMESLAKLAAAEPGRVKMKTLAVKTPNPETPLEAQRSEEANYNDTDANQTVEVAQLKPQQPEWDSHQTMEVEDGNGSSAPQSSQPEDRTSQETDLDGKRNDQTQVIVEEGDEQEGSGKRSPLGQVIGKEQEQVKDIMQEASLETSQYGQNGQRNEDKSHEDRGKDGHQTGEVSQGGDDTNGNDDVLEEGESKTAQETNNGNQEKGLFDEGVTILGEDPDLNAQESQRSENAGPAAVSPKSFVPEPEPEPAAEIEPQKELSPSPSQHPQKFDILLPLSNCSSPSESNGKVEAKRPRGCPPKTQPQTVTKVSGDQEEEGRSVPQKRGRGRPRKRETEAEDPEMAAAGGKRKAAESPVAAVPAEKKKRGRPPKKH